MALPIDQECNIEHGLNCIPRRLYHGNMNISGLKENIFQILMCPDFKKSSCHPVDFRKLPCPVSLSFYFTCRMSPRPRKGHVAVSILGVYTHNIEHIHRCIYRPPILLERQENLAWVKDPCGK